MEKNKDCMYCMEDERRGNLMIGVAELEVEMIAQIKKHL